MKPLPSNDKSIHDRTRPVLYAFLFFGLTFLLTMMGQVTQAYASKNFPLMTWLPYAQFVVGTPPSIAGLLLLILIYRWQGLSWLLTQFNPAKICWIWFVLAGFIIAPIESSMLRCTFAPSGLLLLLVISSLLQSSSHPIAEVPTLEAKAVDSGNSSTVPIRQTQTRSIEYTAMNAVRQQRSTDVTYTVNEIVLEYRKFVDPETGAQLQYAVYRPVQKQKTTTIDYFATIMVPEKKQATIEYPTSGM